MEGRRLLNLDIVGGIKEEAEVHITMLADTGPKGSGCGRCTRVLPEISWPPAECDQATGLAEGALSDRVLIWTVPDVCYLCMM